MKACCCPVRIGALVGTSICLVVHLALVPFFWSGADFNTRAPDQASLFCSYPDSVTAAYREPNVCTNNADPCMKDGAKLTQDEFRAQDWASNTTGGLWNASFTALLLSWAVAMLGLIIKNKMISKIAAGLVVLVIVLYTVTWIIGWSTGPQYTEMEAAERQYWFFWKTAQCNNTDMADAVIAGLKSMDVEPLHAMDHADYGPLTVDPRWCAQVPQHPQFGASMWRQADKTGPADTYAACPGEEDGYFPLGALTFFILLWIINVPLQVWNVFAVWQAANEFGKAPEGKASAQGQA